MYDKNTLISEIIKNENAEEIAVILFSYGMHCLNCMMAHNETIEEACLSHGVEVDELLEKINGLF